MSAADALDYEQIVTIVRSWSPSQQAALVQDLIGALATADAGARPTLQRARGILANGDTVPTDETLREWKAERLKERYGL